MVKPHRADVGRAAVMRFGTVVPHHEDRSLGHGIRPREAIQRRGGAIKIRLIQFLTVQIYIFRLFVDRHHIAGNADHPLDDRFFVVPAHDHDVAARRGVARVEHNEAIAVVQRVQHGSARHADNAKHKGEQQRHTHQGEHRRL